MSSSSTSKSASLMDLSASFFGVSTKKVQFDVKVPLLAMIDDQTATSLVTSLSSSSSLLQGDRRSDPLKGGGGGCLSRGAGEDCSSLLAQHASSTEVFACEARLRSLARAARSASTTACPQRVRLCWRVDLLVRQSFHGDHGCVPSFLWCFILPRMHNQECDSS